jgi:CRISPR-associated protein Cas1
VLDGYGSFLGMQKGCYILKDKNGNVEQYPQFSNQIKEVILKSGNTVSVGALANFGFWNIDVIILTQKGMPVATLKSIDDDSHVAVRISQYQAINNGKGLEIAKQLVIAKLKGQNILLRKHGLKQHDYLTVKSKIENATNKQNLLTIEGHITEHYFQQIFQLLPKQIRITKRETYKSYDAVNNIFNLAYTILKWKVTIAINKSKLEPFLGYLHSLQYSKPSLVCDLMELYRYMIDDYVIQYCMTLNHKDFTMKTEHYSTNRKGKRQFLNDNKTMMLTHGLTEYFNKTVNIARIRHGKKQTLETLIYEETLLLAKYVQNERETWIPRIANL